MIAESPDYDAIHWGCGPGLLVCIRCGALVFPDPAATEDRHSLWHAANDKAPA